MANYQTHIAVGTVVSGALATLTLAADVVGPESLVAVTLAGVVGSILPDIDLKDSRASRILFSGIGVFASFCVLFLCASNMSIAELWIVWLGSLVFVRYGLHAVFHHISVHRGVWHSLIAAVFCAAITAILFKYALGRHEGVAWLAGGFMFIGYITHLVLDEIYSVDFLDRRIKASFGTALKIFDSRYPWSSAGMAAATILVLVVTPSPQTFVEHITSRDIWAGLHERMLPQDKWFGVIGEDGRISFAAPEHGPGFSPVPDDLAAGSPAATRDITTGSVPATGSEPEASR